MKIQRHKCSQSHPISKHGESKEGLKFWHPEKRWTEAGQGAHGSSLCFFHLPGPCPTSHISEAFSEGYLIQCPKHRDGHSCYLHLLDEETWGASKIGDLSAASWLPSSRAEWGWLTICKIWCLNQGSHRLPGIIGQPRIKISTAWLHPLCLASL